MKQLKLGTNHNSDWSPVNYFNIFLLTVIY